MISSTASGGAYIGPSSGASQDTMQAFLKSVPSPLRRSGGILSTPSGAPSGAAKLSGSAKLSGKLSGGNYFTPNAVNSIARPRPVLSVNDKGAYVDPINFENRPNIPLRKIPCTAQLATNSLGFRGQSFRKCFIEHLVKMVKPAFDASNAARGNVARMNAACGQKKIAPHQIVVSEIAKVMAAVPTEKLGGHRGLIMWSNAGSGKTVGSLAVLFAFWPSRRQIFVVTSVSNKAQARNSYLKDAPEFFPREYREVCDEYRSRTGSTASDSDVFKTAFEKRVKVYSFEEARNRVAPGTNKFTTVKDLNMFAGEGSVMVIDEAHGLSMRSATDKKDTAVQLGCALRGLTREQMNKLCVFAMTATPGNSIRQWMKLLSVVRRSDQTPFALDTDLRTECAAYLKVVPGAKDDASALERRLGEAMTGKSNSKASFASIVKYVNQSLFGLVSYVDIRSDLSTHACVKEIDMLVPLDTHYYLAMLKTMVAYKADSKKVDQFLRNPSTISKFMKDSRVMSSSLTKDQYGKYGKCPPEFLEYMRKHHRFLVVGPSERLVSPKLVRAAEYIATRPGKQYAYTANPNHKTIAKALETWHGMRDVTGIFEGDATLVARAIAGIESSRGKNVVGLRPSRSKRSFVVLEGSTPPEARKALVAIFNSAANVNGDYIRAVIATDQLYEGLDLAGLEHVHVIDPMPSPLQEIQLIGRGPRFCSHRGLPMNRRVVHVVRWFATAPKNSSWKTLEPFLSKTKSDSLVALHREYDRIQGRGYDEFVFRESRGDQSFATLWNFEQIMKSASLDCAVLSRYHPGLSCSVPRLSKTVTISAGSTCR